MNQTKYILVTWPDCQELMTKPWFHECIFVQDIRGYVECGSSAYMVPEERYKELYGEKNKMKTIEVLTENNVSITALVIYEHCDGIPARDEWICPEYICYAQNRLFHYHNVRGLWEMEIIVEYIVCPEWDECLRAGK